MNLETPLKIWILFGVILIFAEFFVPGLVTIFLGLGALTVAGLLHLKYIDSIAAQFSAWFIISTVYIFSLRILVMRYYPMDTEKKIIDEDIMMIGKIVEVIETIPAAGAGRVRFGESTWTATSGGDGPIFAGEKVRIVARDNISWVVEKPNGGEL